LEKFYRKRGAFQVKKLLSSTTGVFSKRETKILFTIIMMLTVSLALPIRVVTFSSSENTSSTTIPKTEEIFEGGFSPHEITPTPNERFNVEFSIIPTKNAPNTKIHFIIPAGLVEMVEGVTEWTGNVNKGETLTLSFSFATLGEIEATVIAEVKNSIGSSGKEYSSSFFLQIATGNTKTAQGAGKIKPFSLEEIKPLNIQAVSTRASMDPERMGSSMEATPGSDEIRIYGTFFYPNDESGYSPARYMNCRIMESNSPGADTLIWSGWTNASGSYDVIIDNIDPEGGGRDPYVQLWAIGQWDWETKNGAGATYYWQTGVLKVDCEGGEELSAGGVPTSNGEALLIGDACFEEAQWIYDRVGWSRPTRVDIRWPFEDWPHSHGDSIHIPTTWGGGHVTIHHEYAHCVMWTLYGNSWPDGTEGGDHWVWMEDVLPDAWAEGWAEFMQCAVDNDPTNLGGDITNIENNDWYNWSDAGDLDGAYIEGSVASILWDILDPLDNADRDPMSWGFNEIFTVLQSDNPNNMYQFWDEWETHWSDLDTSIGPLSSIYWNYGIDEDWYAPWGDITINGNDDYASSRTVELTLSADDWGSGVRYMRFSEDEGSTWGSWESFTTTYAFTITDPDDGTKRIDVQYADYWGQSYSDNRSPPGIIYDEIILDTTPPTGSITINFGDPISTTSNLVTLYLTFSDDTSEVNAVRYKNEGEEWTSWLSSSSTKKWILPAGEGSKRVYYQIRDVVGHESIEYYDDIGFEPASTSAHIYIEHPYRSDLHVNIGVKNIADELQWIESFWWGEGGNFENLDLILDISWATSNLPPSENNRWFVEVYDDEIYDEGQISEFTITYMDTEYASNDPPVPINDLETSYAYIPSYWSPPPIGKLVVRGSNNGIYYRSYNFTADYWGNWIALPGSTCDTPAAAIYDDELYIVVRGTDGASLWFGSVDLSDNSFSGWSYLSGTTPSKPILVCWENGQRLILVVRGSDNQIYHRHYDIPSDIWYDWSTLIPGSTPESPAAAVDGDYLNLVVRGMDDNLYYMKFSLIIPIMPGWTWIGGTTPSAPALTSNFKTEGDDHLLYLIVRGSDNGIYLRSYDGSWSGWTKLSGSTNDAFGACIQPPRPDADACLHILVRGMDSAMYHGKYDLNSETFLGWSWMSGTTPSPPTLIS
jgi:hypothetical protein